MEDLKEYVRKGTTTVGIKCTDGIVLAADKRATFGGHIIADKRVEKVLKISDNIAVTIAGSVSDAQLISKLLRSELKLKKIRTGKETTVNETANLLGVIVYHNIRRMSMIPAITGFLIGGVDDTGFHLYEIGVDGSVMEREDYVSDGSGFMSALGVLDTMYKSDVKVNDAMKLAMRAINAAMQRDTATGEGIDIYTITKQGIKKVLTRIVDTSLPIA